MEFASVLILLFLTGGIDGQIVSVSTFDTAYVEYCRNLRNQELSIATSASDLSLQLAAVNSSLSSIPKLQSACQDAANRLDLIKTIDNFSPCEIVPTCNDINQKITSLQMEAQKCLTLMTFAALNASSLQGFCNWIQFYYTINRATVPSSVNIQSLLDYCTSNVKTLTSYVSTLSSTRTALLSIINNLKNYKSSYCACSSGTQNAISTVTNSSARIESIFLGDQSNIVSAANDAKTKISTASSLITSISALTDLMTKASGIANKSAALIDFPILDTSVIACSDKTSQTSFARAKYNLYASIYSTTASSYGLCVAYAAGINTLSIAYASTFNTTQKTALNDVNKALTKLSNFYLKYTQDLAAGLGRTGEIIGEVQIPGSSYCACNASLTTTTIATTTTVSTSLAPTAYCKQRAVNVINGVSYKNLCLVGNSLSSADAKTSCQGQGMNLYAIETKEDLDGVLKIAASWIGGTPDIGFFINGNFDGTSWTVTNPTQKALYSGAIPTIGSGDCLMVASDSVGTTTTTAMKPCTNTLWFICEYYANSVL